MKLIHLKVPRVIGGELRQPAEGAIPVQDDVADQLIEDEAAEQVDAEQEGSFEGDGLDGKTVAELREIAEAENVDLVGREKKAELIAAIREGRSA